MPVWSDVVGTFLNSIVVLTPNGQFLGCVTVVFCERHVLKGVRGPVVVLGLSLSYTGLQCFCERHILKGVLRPVVVLGLLLSYTGLQCFRTSVAQITCGARIISWFLCALLPNVFTFTAAIPLYLLLNKLHLFSLTQNSCVLDSIKRSLIINKHDGMAATYACCYHSILFHQSIQESKMKHPKM